MRRPLLEGNESMNLLPRSSGWRAALLAVATCLLPAAARAQGRAPLPQQTACSFTGAVHELRLALREGSPAYRRYRLEQLKEMARAMPADELLAAIQQEREPSVLEALGAALSAKASYSQDPSLLQPLLQRAMGDGDPELRAAAVRGLQGIASVDMMERNGGVVTYSQLMRDPSPAVREAVAGNLIAESARVYFGHDRGVSEVAVAAALASPDPAVAAKLLREVSMEQVGRETVEQLRGQLRAESPELRAAAATALGGGPGAHSASARGSLVELYRNDKDPAVRKAALEGLVRLGLSGSRGTLESLRGVAPALDSEIDAWQSVLKLNLQDWSLVLREKQRLAR
jgi:hypothetical protein